ncbi:MAG: nucleoid-associated protein GapR [Caulobacteraceae bacterium]
MADDSSSIEVLNSTAQTRLKTIIERVERLEEEKAGIANDITEVFAEAKGEGFDVKILRKVVRLRKQDKAKRQEEEALLDLYLAAIGGL